jgi:hypothetical protein
MLTGGRRQSISERQSAARRRRPRGGLSGRARAGRQARVLYQTSALHCQIGPDWIDRGDTSFLLGGRSRDGYEPVVVVVVGAAVTTVMLSGLMY